MVAFEDREGEPGVDLKEKGVIRALVSRFRFYEGDLFLEIIGGCWEFRLTCKGSIAVFREEDKGWVAFGKR